MSRAGAIFGSALAGLGKGVTDQSNNVRDRAIKQMEIDAQTALQRERMAFDQGENVLNRQATADNTDKQVGAQEFDTVAQIAGAQTRSREQSASEEARTKMTEEGANTRNAADITARKGLLHSTFIDQTTGNVNTIDEGGKVADTGHKAQEKDFTAKQKLALENAKTIATTPGVAHIDPSDDSSPPGKPTFDLEKYATALRAAAKKDKAFEGLADMAIAANAPIEAPSVDSVDPNGSPSAVVTPDDQGAARKPRGLVTDWQDPDQAGAAPPAGGTDAPVNPTADPALQSKADKIKLDYKNKKITKDEANRLLNELYKQ